MISKFNKSFVFVAFIAAIFSIIAFSGIAFGQTNIFAHNFFNRVNVDENLVCNYNFYMENKGSTIVPDASGNSNNGTIKKRGDDYSYSLLENVDILGKKQWSFQPYGGYDGTYLELPQNAFRKLRGEGSELTASIWVNITNYSGYQRIFDFGTGQDNYLYVLNCGGNWGFMNYASAIQLDTATGREEGFGSENNLPLNAWTLVTVTMDNQGELKLYCNKELIGSAKTQARVSDLADAIVNQSVEQGGDTHCYIAASNYGDACTAAKFADFRLYNRALSSDEIESLYYPTDKNLADADAELISIEQTSDITSDFRLQASGVYGSNITWESDNSAIQISEKIIDPETYEEYYLAKVTRPDYGCDSSIVNLCATAVFGNESSNKNIEVSVKPNNPDEEIAKEDLEYALNLVQGVILEGYVLPEYGPNGSTYLWSSNIDNVSINADNSLTVIRPNELENAIEGKLYLSSKYKSAEVQGNNFTKVVPIDNSKNISSVQNLDTIFYDEGDIPRFPNFIDVIFTDGTSAKAQVKWPTDIKPESVASSYTGLIIGTDKAVSVNVEKNLSAQYKDKQAELFNLEDIDLCGDSFLVDNRSRDIEYLKVLGAYTNDPAKGIKVMRILYNFYITFGIYNSDELSALGIEALGGWEEPNGLLRGHSIGHYISALSLAYASTQDSELAAIMENIISQLAYMQSLSSKNHPERTSKDFTPKIYDENDHYGIADDFKTRILKYALLTENWSKDPEKWGRGFISSYSPDQFVLLEMGAPYSTADKGIWAPYYTMHKLLAGFIEAYNHAPNEIVKQNALQLLSGTGLWASIRICKIIDDEQGGYDQLRKMWDTYIAGEYGGMNEVLEKVYEIGKVTKTLTDEQLATLKRGSKGFDNISLFGNLTKNIDGIKELHANQHIPQIIGSIFEHASAFEDGQQTTNHYFDIAKNFWEYVRGRYAYSTGGVGKGEKFTNPYGQGASIGVYGDKDSNCETCCVYNLLKLTAQLNSYDPDNAEYMDYYEKGLYNQILASQNPESSEDAHNGVTYMLPIGPGGQRGYGDDFYDFSCCCGTGMENHVKYQEATYFKSSDNNTLYVGLYLPTTLNWQEKGIIISQETKFPSDTSIIKIGGTGSCTLKLRVPAWATSGFFVNKNGQDLYVNAVPGTYESVNVSAGDVLVVRMPWTVRCELTPDKVNDNYLGSIMYGPFVMAAKSNSLDYLDLFLHNDISKSVELGSFDNRGLPTLETNGYTFYAMPSTSIAYDAYHTYSQIHFLDNEGKPSEFFYASRNPYSPQPTPVPEPVPTPEVQAADNIVSTGDMVPITLLFVFALSLFLTLGIRKYYSK